MARGFSAASTQYLNNANPVVTGPPATFSCWFYANDADNVYDLVYVGDKDSAINRLRLVLRGDSGDVVAFRARDNDSLIKQAGATTAFSPSTWHHAAGKIVGGTVYAYIDGGNEGSLGGLGSFANFSDTVISGFWNSSILSTPLDGYIAEAAIWNVDLSLAEIAILGLGYSPLFVRPASLVAYWQTLGRTSPEIDIVGGYDMTLVNGPTTSPHPRIIYPQQQLWTPPPLIGGLSRRGIGRGIMRGVGRGV